MAIDSVPKMVAEQMALSRADVMKAIHDIDPVTGDCAKCGCRREVMDDNLGEAKVCLEAQGEHRVALMEMRKALMRRKENVIQQTFSPGWRERLEQEIVRKDAECSELQASIRTLETQATAPKWNSPSLFECAGPWSGPAVEPPASEVGFGERE